MPPTLSLTLGPAASFGAFTPGVARVHGVDDRERHQHGGYCEAECVAERGRPGPSHERLVPARTAAAGADHAGVVEDGTRVQRGGGDPVQAVDQGRRAPAHRRLQPHADVHTVDDESVANHSATRSDAARRRRKYAAQGEVQLARRGLVAGGRVEVAADQHAAACSCSSGVVAERARGGVLEPGAQGVGAGAAEVAEVASRGRSRPSSVAGREARARGGRGRAGRRAGRPARQSSTWHSQPSRVGLPGCGAAPTAALKASAARARSGGRSAGRRSAGCAAPAREDRRHVEQRLHARAGVAHERRRSRARRSRPARARARASGRAAGRRGRAAESVLSRRRRRPRSRAGGRRRRGRGARGCGSSRRSRHARRGVGREDRRRRGAGPVTWWSTPPSQL